MVSATLCAPPPERVGWRGWTRLSRAVWAVDPPKRVRPPHQGAHERGASRGRHEELPRACAPDRKRAGPHRTEHPHGRTNGAGTQRATIKRPQRDAPRSREASRAAEKASVRSPRVASPSQLGPLFATAALHWHPARSHNNMTARQPEERTGVLKSCSASQTSRCAFGR